MANERFLREDWMSGRNEVTGTVWKPKKRKHLTSEELMAIDDKIWRRHGWGSSSQVRFGVFKRELKKEIGNQKFSEKTYDELENENFHTLNEALADLNAFEQPFQKRIAKSYSNLRDDYPREYADSRHKRKKLRDVS